VIVNVVVVLVGYPRVVGTCTSRVAASAKVAVCFEIRKKKHSKKSEHHVEFFLVEICKETARL
jgi:hypothetical protein